MWGRQCYRLSDLDFEANAKEGVGIDWPIRYKDLKPWYDHVSRFVGISGQAENLAHLPDGPFLPGIPMNCVEEVFRDAVHEQFPERRVTVARVAHLTAYDPKVHLGPRGLQQRLQHHPGGGGDGENDDRPQRRRAGGDLRCG